MTLLLTLFAIAATAYIAYRLGRAEAQDDAVAEQKRLRGMALEVCDRFEAEVATHRRMERIQAQAATALREHIELMAADNERLTEENTRWRQWFYKAESEMDAT